MKIGYARVSTDEQNNSLQVDALQKFGTDKIFLEQASGRTKNRPELKRMLDTLRPGDTVIVWRLDRLGRSLKDLIELIETFRVGGVTFVSISEQIDTGTAVGELTFHIFASIAQLERLLNSERTKAGLASARARGRVGGRKPSLTAQQVKLAQSMLLDSSVTIKEAAEHFGVSRPTLYKALKTF
jgi:DNA invertase Pin-like site-specific DNA recombinase